MINGEAIRGHGQGRRSAAAGLIWAVALCLTGLASPASAYIGDSFLQLPGVTGDWHGDAHKNWVRFDANYWGNAPLRFAVRRNTGGGSSGRIPMFFTGPTAPRNGEESLMLSIDKHNPSLGKLMALCQAKTVLPEATYAESAERARPSGEVGPRPADLPEYWEYKLSNVTLSDCPVVPKAPDQAIVVHFKDIQWLNYKGEKEGEATALQPAVMPVAKKTGQTKTFVVNWFGYAHDASDDQCPQMNAKPTQDQYYMYLAPAAAAAERARLQSKGGADYADGQMCLRGPDQLNVCRLPGIVADPGQFAPRATVVRGINLDGDDGTGPPPKGVRRHTNFVSPDGVHGIDNQLYTVLGCMMGWQGHKGQLIQYANESRRTGGLSILVQITGIDNLQNDNDVDVTLFYSGDPVGKNSTGTDVLPYYTFRVHDKIDYTHSFRRWKARIVNGEIITDQIAEMPMNIPLTGTVVLRQAAMRLRIMPDGTLKGVLGGYQDWRQVVTMNGHSQQESLYGGDVAAMYNAMKRAADGMWNPQTQEYDGISSAYDVEGVPAFVAPEHEPVLVAGDMRKITQP